MMVNQLILGFFLDDVDTVDIFQLKNKPDSALWWTNCSGDTCKLYVSHCCTAIFLLKIS